MSLTIGVGAWDLVFLWSLKFGVWSLPQIPSFPIAQDSARLPQTSALRHKLVRRSGIELKHIVVAGNHAARADGMCQFGGLATIEVAGHTSLRPVAVDREHGQIYRASFQRRRKALMPERVAAVINCQPSPSHHVPKKTAPAFSIALHGWVRRGDTLNLNIAHLCRCPIVQ